MACFLSYLPHVSSGGGTKGDGGEKEVEAKAKVKIKGTTQSLHSLMYAMLTTIRCSPRLGSRVGGNPRQEGRDEK